MKTRNNSPIKKPPSDNDDDDVTPMTTSSSPRKPLPVQPAALSLVDAAAAASSLPSSKRRKIDMEEPMTKIPALQNNNNNSLAAADSAPVIPAAAATQVVMMETIDVANDLGLKPGDRIEVKWNINDDEDEDDDEEDVDEDHKPAPPQVTTDAAGGQRLGLPKTEGEDDDDHDDIDDATTKNNNNNNNDDDKMISNSNSSSPAPPGMISVWWKATVQKATGEYHILDDVEETVECGYPPPPPPPPTATNTTTTANSAVADDKDYKYNCPKCTKKDMSKQGLYTHYGMVHGGKISRDFPNLLSEQQQQQQQYNNHNSTSFHKNNNNNNKTAATAASAKSLPIVRVPIYEIVYDPLPSLGFPDYSNEEVAFISNATLLNLSSEEMMNFRKEGEIFAISSSTGGSSSSSIGPRIIERDGVGVGRVVAVGHEEDVLMKDIMGSSDGGGGGGGRLGGILLFGDEANTAKTTANIPSNNNNNNNINANDIYKEFRSEDDIRSYMNELMQKSMISTGMNARMASLPRSQQNVIAGRINKALEGLLGKMMEEMGKMEGGNRVVTADVVRRCMEQMRRV